MNDRDIHFNSFTVMLYDEVKPLFEKREQAIATKNYRLAQHYENQIQTTIAHRAYDLVGHTIDALWPYINDRAIDPSAANIPDMTEFP